MFHITLEQGHSVLLTMLAVAAAAVVLAGYSIAAIFAQVIALAAAVAAGLADGGDPPGRVLAVPAGPEPGARSASSAGAVILALDTSASMSTADDATGTTPVRAGAGPAFWTGRPG